MRTLLLILSMLPLLVGTANAEPALTAVSVNLNTSGAVNQRIHVDKNLQVTNVSVRQLIEFSYRVNKQQIEGGPAWLDTDRFDIVAQPNTQDKPSPAQWRAMIQELLGTQFNLTLNRVDRQLPVYTIAVADSGPKMTEGDPNGPGDPDFNGLGNMRANSMNMEDLAALLQMMVLDRPVLDKTGLSARYVFTLVWAPDDAQFPTFRGRRPPPQAFAGRKDLFTAMQMQLGLKLEPTTAPVEILIIDQADRPSLN